MSNVKAAIYCRLSKEDLHEINESESIQNQRKMLIDYALQMNWKIYDIYSDDGLSGAYSGSENNRPEFLRLINDAEKSCFDVVLCKSQSRFSRNTEVIERYIHGLFTEKNIRFVSIADNADTAVKGNKKARQINSLINEWYLEDLSENVKCVLENKMKDGKFIGSFAPYGYMKDVDDHNRLIVNPKPAEIVRWIFSQSLDGFGTVKICRNLNDMNIPNPRKQQEIDGLRKKYIYTHDDNGLWSVSSVSDILHNVEYTGCTAQHKSEKISYKHKGIRKLDSSEWIIVQNTHEPIISVNEFNSVQKLLSNKRKSSGTGRVHILSGLVKCMDCGLYMQKNHSTKVYLRCRNKYIKTDIRCSTPNIRLDFILKAIRSDYIENLLSQYIKDNAINFKNQNDDIKIQRITEILKETEEQYKKFDNAKQSLYLDKCSGVITQEEYLKFSDDFENQKQELYKKITELKSYLNDVQRTVYTDVTEEKDMYRRLIRRLIDVIEFGKSTNGGYELKVIWKMKQ